MFDVTFCGVFVLITSFAFKLVKATMCRVIETSFTS